jgi:hypothetical protein
MIGLLWCFPLIKERSVFMALIKYGALISEARGKEAGLVFSRNSYGGYVKQKVSPVNPQTEFQLRERARLGVLAQQWVGLTEVQKDQWKQFGQQMTRVNRFGDQTGYTGFNAYVKCNRNRAIVGLAPISVPVTPISFPVLTVVLTITTVLVSLAFTPTPLTTGLYLVVEATPNILTGRRFIKNFYRLVGASAVSAASPFVLTTLYQNRFGVLPTLGSFVGLRFRLVHGASGWDSSYTVIDDTIKT